MNQFIIEWVDGISVASDSLDECLTECREVGQLAKVYQLDKNGKEIAQWRFHDNELQKVWFRINYNGGGYNFCETDIETKKEIAAAFSNVKRFVPTQVEMIELDNHNFPSKVLQKFNIKVSKVDFVAAV